MAERPQLLLDSLVRMGYLIVREGVIETTVDLGGVRGIEDFLVVDLDSEGRILGIEFSPPADD